MCAVTIPRPLREIREDIAAVVEALDAACATTMPESTRVRRLASEVQTLRNEETEARRRMLDRLYGPVEEYVPTLHVVA